MTDAAAPRVLVVEDDESVRGFLMRALQQAGCEPLPARTGEEALAQLHQDGERVAAVLIDGLLPDMHGIRLARDLINDPAAAALAVCFVSGAIREHVPLRAGIAALSKPLRYRDLLHTLEQMLAWHRNPVDSPESRLAALQEWESTFLVGP
jgi:two-component system cell cycle response regulator CpdR